MNTALVTIGNSFAPGAYTDAAGALVTVPPQAALCVHEFAASADGCLVHSIEGRERATVPPEGFDAYVALWPDAAPIVRQLRGGGKREKTAKRAATKRRYG